MKHRTAALGLFGVLVAGAGIAAQAVSADPFGEWNPGTASSGVAPDSGSIPDDLLHTYCFENYVEESWDDEGTPVTRTVSMPDAGRRAIHQAMANLDRQTDYRVQYQIRCNSRTDVRILPVSKSGTWGVWRCETFVPGTALCEQGELGINSALATPEGNAEFQESSGFPGIDQFAKIACHEIGHSVGLAHGEGPDYDDCMQSGVPQPNPPRVYNTHHVDHINSRTPASE